MKQSFKEKLAKVGKFFKKNGYYFLIVICIAAVASMIGVAVAQNNRRNADIDNNITRPDNSGDNGGQKPPVEDEVDPEPVEDKLTFALPSTGEITGHFEFVFNEILGDYRNHDGIDFVAKDGDINVYAAADGVVKRVDYDVLYGYYIEIEHADDYVTRYMSLSDDIKVEVGQQVKKGDHIGYMSTSMSCEKLEQPTLHFEIVLKNEWINPLDVFNESEK